MPGKGNGRSLTLGIQMGPSSQARKLVTSADYEHHVAQQQQILNNMANSSGSPVRTVSIPRPLSPVRFRRVLPTDDENQQKVKVLSIRQKNESRARGSPFVAHMDKKKKEHWLYSIGSVQEIDDPDLKMEMTLQDQLSKILVSPIKGGGSSSSSSSPFSPKLLPTRSQGSKGNGNGNGNDKIRTQVVLPTIRQSPEPNNNNNNNNNNKKNKNNNIRRDLKFQNSPIVNNNSGRSNSNMNMNNSHHNSHGVVGHGHNNGHFFPEEDTTADTGTDMDTYLNSMNNMNMNNMNMNGMDVMDSMNDMNNINNMQMRYGHRAATPGSETQMSDLSDRDTTTPMSTHFGYDGNASGLSDGGGSLPYGDFEDDLVSAGTNEEDEYILEEQI